MQFIINTLVTKIINSKLTPKTVKFRINWKNPWGLLIGFWWSKNVEDALQEMCSSSSLTDNTPLRSPAMWLPHHFRHTSLTLISCLANRLLLVLPLTITTWVTLRVWLAKGLYLPQSHSWPASLGDRNIQSKCMISLLSYANASKDPKRAGLRQEGGDSTQRLHYLVKRLAYTILCFF